jgi:hypothetical protein
MMRQVMTARLSSNWIAICGLSLLSLAAASPSCSSPAAQHGGECSAHRRCGASLVNSAEQTPAAA